MKRRHLILGALAVAGCAALTPPVQAGVGQIIGAVESLFGGQIRVDAATTGQAIVKQADGSWQPGAAGSTTIDGLTDVTITAAADGEFLRFEATGAAWVDSSSAITDQSDVDAAATFAATSGQALTWNGSAWAPATAAGEVDTLATVVARGADATGQGAVTVDGLTAGAAGSGTVSVPGTGAGSEQFGSGATTPTGTLSTAVGNGATGGSRSVSVGNAADSNGGGGDNVADGAQSVATGGLSTAVGFSADSTGAGDTSLGAGAGATGGNGLAAGRSTSTAAAGSIALNTGAASIGAGSTDAIVAGNGSTLGTNSTGSIVISDGGTGASSSINQLLIGTAVTGTGPHAVYVGRGDGANVAATNEAVFGGLFVEDVWMGARAAQLAGLPTVTIHAADITGGAGDLAGAGLSFAPGTGSGNATPSVIQFLTSDSLASGVALQTNTARYQIDGETLEVFHQGVVWASVAPVDTLANTFRVGDGAGGNGSILAEIGYLESLQLADGEVGLVSLGGGLLAVDDPASANEARIFFNVLSTSNAILDVTGGSVGNNLQVRSEGIQLIPQGNNPVTVDLDGSLGLSTISFRDVNSANDTKFGWSPSAGAVKLSIDQHLSWDDDTSVDLGGAVQAGIVPITSEINTLRASDGGTENGQIMAERFVFGGAAGLRLTDSGLGGLILEQADGVNADHLALSFVATSAGASTGEAVLDTVASTGRLALTTGSNIVWSDSTTLATAGTRDVSITRISSATLVLGQSGGVAATLGGGRLHYGRVVVALTAANTQITPAQTAALFTNVGASSEVRATLPGDPFVGMQAQFVRVAAQRLEVVPSTTDTITYSGGSGVAALRLDSDGASLELTYVGANVWVATDELGTLTE